MDLSTLVTDITTHFDTQISRDEKFAEILKIIASPARPAGRADLPIPEASTSRTVHDTGERKRTPTEIQQNLNDRSSGLSKTPPGPTVTAMETGIPTPAPIPDGVLGRETEAQHKSATPSPHATTLYHSQPHTTQQDSGPNKILTACDIPGWQPWGGASGKWTQLGTIGGGTCPVGHSGVAGELKRTIR